MIRTPTIYEIAEEAGVSIATVSRAMNTGTRHKVAPETLRAVEAVMHRNRYTPSLAAKHLTSATYKTFGIVFPHHKGMLKSDYYTDILNGVSDALLESEYRMKLIMLKPGQGPWDHYDFKKGEAVDGLILTYWRSVFSDEKALRKLQVPCVVINNTEPSVNAHFVSGDHYEGGYRAAEYLYEKGHRRIAVIGGKMCSPDVRARLNGFRACLKAKGIKLAADAIFDVNYEEQRAYDVTDEILSRKPAFTAVFCMNDLQAFGVLRRLEELDVPCPERISVMGFDNERRSEYTRPGLTTIRVPVYDLGGWAVRDLIDFLEIQDRENFDRPRTLPVELVERGSVGSPRRKQ